MTKYNFTNEQKSAIVPFFRSWKNGEPRPGMKQYANIQKELKKSKVPPHNLRLHPSPKKQWQVLLETPPEPPIGWAIDPIPVKASAHTIENAAIFAFRTLWNGWAEKENAELAKLSLEILAPPHAVAILIFNENNAVCMNVRIGTKKYKGFYQTPGGSVEKETPAAAANRELKEETGITVETLNHLETTEEKYENGDKYFVHWFWTKIPPNTTPQNLEKKLHSDWKFVDLTQIKALEKLGKLMPNTLEMIEKTHNKIN
jgi:8-oxo-dGTP pyrophosphatase MutT (NUDIX family)